jgi:hypothetical protein
MIKEEKKLILGNTSGDTAHYHQVENSEIEEFDIRLSRTMAVPEPAGGFRIGNTVGYSQINLMTKPKWFHRKMMKLCLGWEWVDNK